jgi:hypothetical protein
VEAVDILAHRLLDDLRRAGVVDAIRHARVRTLQFFDGLYLDLHHLAGNLARAVGPGPIADACIQIRRVLGGEGAASPIIAEAYVGARMAPARGLSIYFLALRSDRPLPRAGVREAGGGPTSSTRLRGRRRAPPTRLGRLVRAATGPLGVAWAAPARPATPGNERGGGISARAEAGGHGSPLPGSTAPGAIPRIMALQTRATVPRPRDKSRSGPFFWPSPETDRVEANRLHGAQHRHRAVVHPRQDPGEGAAKLRSGVGQGCRLPNRSWGGERRAAAALHGRRHPTEASVVASDGHIHESNSR